MFICFNFKPNYICFNYKQFWKIVKMRSAGGGAHFSFPGNKVYSVGKAFLSSDLAFSIAALKSIIALETAFLLAVISV